MLCWGKGLHNGGRLYDSEHQGQIQPQKTLLNQKKATGNPPAVLFLQETGGAETSSKTPLLPSQRAPAAAAAR